MDGLSIGDNVTFIFGSKDDDLLELTGNVVDSGTQTLRLRVKATIVAKERTVHICKHKVMYYYKNN